MNIKEGETDDAGPRNNEEEKSFRRAEGRRWPLIRRIFASQEKEQEWQGYTQVHTSIWTQCLGEEFPVKSDGIISWDGEWTRRKGWDYGCWRANIKPGLQFLPFSFHSQYSNPSSGLNSLQLYNHDGLLKVLSHPAFPWPLSPLSTHSLEGSLQTINSWKPLMGFTGFYTMLELLIQACRVLHLLVQPTFACLHPINTSSSPPPVAELLQPSHCSSPLLEHVSLVCLCLSSLVYLACPFPFAEVLPIFQDPTWMLLISQNLPDPSITINVASHSSYFFKLYFLIKKKVCLI